MSVPRCAGTKADGLPCNWPPFPGSTLCLNHAATAGEPSALAEQRRRGQLAREKKAQHARERLARVVKLRTPGDLLDALERVASALAASKESASTKATSMCRVVSSACEILKAGELATENVELKKLLLERHPELKKHLKAMP